ncbi:MAG: cadherin-like domain-containing protein, partial [Candidatus Bipolaricaulota bacterium]
MMRRGRQGSALRWVTVLGGLSLLCFLLGVATAHAVPVAEDDRVFIDWESVEHEIDVLANDRETAGGTLEIIAVGPTSRGGRLSIRSDGQALQYWPSGPFEGKETFEYTVANAVGETSTASVTVTVRFNYTVDGEKTWTLSYGFGKTGQSSNRLILEQTLAVELYGEAMSILFVEASFDDRLPLQEQRLTVSLDTEYVKGILGDFSLTGKGDFAVYNKKMKGVRIDVLFGEDEGQPRPQITGVLSQVEGISASRTFVGRTASGEIEYVGPAADPLQDDPPYLRDVAGLYYITLDRPFVSGLSEVELAFEASPALTGTLDAYDLGFLASAVTTLVLEPLSAGEFIVPESVSEFIILRRAPDALVREAVRELIAAWNADASAGERAQYPFVEGSTHEKGFLEALRPHMRLLSDGEGPLLSSAQRRRFYTLGETSVDEDSLVVEVRIGDGAYQTIGTPEAPGYAVQLFAEPGLFTLDAPDAFWDASERALRASFSYARSGDMLLLDELSIVPGSVRLLLNGEPLEDEIDFTVDYGELTTVFLLVEIGDEDVLRVDFEQFRGGLGVPVEYARSFYGLSFALPLGLRGDLGFSALEAADSPTPLQEGEARTMPNRHTVLGVTGTLHEPGFSSTFALGYSRDRFPLDDNLRPPLPGRATGILAAEDRVFVAHLQGVSVFEGGRWTLLTANDGLTSSRVVDVAFDGEAVLFATSAGVTRVVLSGEAPLARVANWSRFLLGVQLPEGVAQSVAAGADRLWFATERDVATILLDEIGAGGAWDLFAADALTAVAPIRDLAVSGRTLFVAGEGGLLRVDVDSELAHAVPGLAGIPVASLYASGEELLACTRDGVARVDGTGGLEWLVVGESVTVATDVNGELWYASGQGLRTLSGETILAPWVIAAVTADTDGGLWAASEADDAYDLWVWRHQGAATTAFAPTETGIGGRDPEAFTDLDAADHTARGWLARASFDRELGGLSLSGSLRAETTGFSSIGQSGGRDALGWTLTGRLDLLDGARIDGTHDFEQLGIHGGAGRTAVGNRASLRLELGRLLARLVSDDAEVADDGPSLRLSLNQEVVGPNVFTRGSEDWTLSAGGTLSDHLFGADDSSTGGSLGLTLSWRQTFSGQATSVERRSSHL